MIHLILALRLLEITNRVIEAKLVPNPRTMEKVPYADPFLPWPQPKSVNDNPGSYIHIDPIKLSFDTNINCSLIESAIERYANIMFPYEYVALLKTTSETSADGVLTKIKLYVKNSHTCYQYPSLDMDETYRIEFKPDSRSNTRIKEEIDQITNKINDEKEVAQSHYYNCEIEASSVWGLLRGFESLSQMINFNQDQQYIVSRKSIKDEPYYPHRGLLVDTSRHYIPIPLLRTILDGMSYNKLNVFHWHMVDDHSFPFESKVFPELTKGAYTPHMIYKQSDITDLIEYARLRGIRIIPEFDTPGHTNSWGKSHKELLTPCYGGDGKIPEVANYPNFPRRDNLDPYSPNTYVFVSKLYEEITKLFKDDFLHAGMDEVFPDCWDTNPIMRNITNSTEPAKAAFAKYVNTTLETLRNGFHKKTIVWQDVLDMNITNIPEDTIIQLWKNWGSYPYTSVNTAAKLKHRVISSTYWYLDNAQHAEEWKDMYNADIERNLNLEYKNLSKRVIIGGEACMWTEYVDANSILTAIWPRTTAIAEKLWVGKGLSQPIDQVEPRLEIQRCRMINRGIPSKPIKPGFCGDYELNAMYDQHTTPQNWTRQLWTLVGMGVAKAQHAF